MDAKAKEQFRWKFYSLAVQLNVIILLVAVSILALFLIPLQYRYPLIAALMGAAVILAFFFQRNYRATRAWLDEQPDKKEDQAAEAGVTGEHHASQDEG